MRLNRCKILFGFFIIIFFSASLLVYFLKARPCIVCSTNLFFKSLFCKTTKVIEEKKIIKIKKKYLILKFRKTYENKKNVIKNKEVLSPEIRTVNTENITKIISKKFNLKLIFKLVVKYKNITKGKNLDK